MHKKIKILLMVFVLMTTIGCTPKEPQTIVGAWDDGSGEITEFSEDGIIYFNGIEELQYQLLEDGQIEILDPYFNTRKLYTYSFEGEKLLFLDRELTPADPMEVDHDHDGDGHADH